MIVGAAVANVADSQFDAFGDEPSATPQEVGKC